MPYYFEEANSRLSSVCLALVIKTAVHIEAYRGSARGMFTEVEVNIHHYSPTLR